VTRRTFSRRRVLTGAAAISAAAILPRTSYGSDWRPTETVRLIVPAAAGGSTDVMGRLLAAHLQRGGLCVAASHQPLPVAVSRMRSITLGASAPA